MLKMPNTRFQRNSGAFLEPPRDIIVVAHNGDISVGGGGTTVTGVFFAPKGKVTFNGDHFEGLVIARDGFHIDSGGTEVFFMPISHYISDPADYPF